MGGGKAPKSYLLAKAKEEHNDIMSYDKTQIITQTCNGHNCEEQRKINWDGKFLPNWFCCNCKDKEHRKW